MWIRTNEQLPPEAKEVQVVHVRDGERRVSAAMQERGEWYGFRGRLHEVTLWRELEHAPEPEPEFEKIVSENASDSPGTGI